MRLVASWSRLLLQRTAGLLVAISLACNAVAAETEERTETHLLHAMFQDHAVLQRDKPLWIWGRARPLEQVRVILAGKSARGTTRWW